MEIPYYIYRLQGVNNNNTIYHYIGSTPTPNKRIRQHNNIIKGGAKYTHSKLEMIKKWKYEWLILTYLSKNEVLSLEWHLKQHKRRYFKFDKNINIMLSQIDITLTYLFNKWTEQNKIINKNISLIIDKQYDNLIEYIPINYKIIEIDYLHDNIENNLITLIEPFEIIS